MRPEFLDLAGQWMKLFELRPIFSIGRSCQIVDEAIVFIPSDQISDFP
jgi:hypothetical protein